MDKGNLQDCGGCASLYTLTDELKTWEPPNSVACDSPGISTVGGSAESSVLLATPRTSYFSSPFLEPRVQTESLNNSLFLEESGVDNGYDFFHSGFIGQASTTANNADSLVRHRPLTIKAPRLATIPLPQLEVETCSSPHALRHFKPSARQLRRSKSIVFIDDDESETSPVVEKGTINERICMGEELVEPSINILGLGITIEEDQQPYDEAIDHVRLRRVDGYLDLKSLWLDVARDTRSPGEFEDLFLSCS